MLGKKKKTPKVLIDLESLAGIHFYYNYCEGEIEFRICMEQRSNSE